MRRDNDLVGAKLFRKFPERRANQDIRVQINNRFGRRIPLVKMFEEERLYRSVELHDIVALNHFC